jgi:hypothetical protein
VLVNRGGRVKYRAFDNVVYRTSHRNWELQKRSFSGHSQQYGLTEVTNVSFALKESA